MLKIHGEHDDNTLKQMWQALGTGSVHKGVLCADGHYGYAHPIGGVIAYEDHISISGVGFDIASGNMAVKLDLTYDDIAAHPDDRPRHKCRSAGMCDRRSLGPRG